MSVILKAGMAISRAQTNCSTAKQMYSFPKAARFPTFKTFQSQNDFYDLPSTKSKRFTTLGYGNKSDFTLGDKTSKSELYNHGSDFDPAKPHGPKYSFSNGRDKYASVYISTVKMVDKSVPGPAKYSYLKPFGHEGPKYTIKGKNENPPTRKEKPKGPPPGPNSYNNIIKMNTTGKYFLSRVPNVNSIKMQFDKTKRSGFVLNKGPGPAEYKQKQLFGGKIIFDSTKESGQSRTILGRYRYKDEREDYPGPGSYVIPSEFGQYRSKDAEKYPKENVYVFKRPKFEEKAWRHGMKIIVKKDGKNTKRSNSSRSVIVCENRKKNEITDENNNNNS